MSGQLLKALNDKGVLYMYGSLSELPASDMSAEDFIFKQKRVAGLFLTAWLRSMEKEEKRRVYSETMKNLSSLYATDICKQFALEEVQQALEFYQKNMSLGKVIICPDKASS
jgi:NADPH:quinone reductase-like Zn-dependent oxidoreductase